MGFLCLHPGFVGLGQGVVNRPEEHFWVWQASGQSQDSGWCCISPCAGEQGEGLQATVRLRKRHGEALSFLTGFFL